MDEIEHCEDLSILKIEKEICKEQFPYFVEELGERRKMKIETQLVDKHKDDGSQE